jgi:hypothetical protein
MHGGADGSGAQPGNQNARRHGVWSKFLTPDDLEFLEEPPAERLALLQGVAELRALRAHQAAAGDDKNEALDTAFNRCARTAANLARTRLALAEAAADGISPDGEAASGGDEPGTMTDDDRVSRLARLLDSGATAGDGGDAGPSPVAAGQPGANRGPAQSG